MRDRKAIDLDGGEWEGTERGRGRGHGDQDVLCLEGEIYFQHNKNCARSM